MKYTFTGQTKTYVGEAFDGWGGVKVRQIKRISDGLVGGWIESKKNLSQDGDCFIYDDAVVCGDAKVYENASVSKSALVYDNARIYGNALIYGNAEVCGDAVVCGDAKVYGYALVCGNVSVYGNARVSGSAIIDWQYSIILL